MFSTRTNMTKHDTAVKIPLSDDDRWEALEKRDTRADGLFYYSVLSTGVYCRPSCASRAARRENVRFYSIPEEAERAGFRPCRRCRPKGATIRDQRIAIVVQACRLIERADQALSLDVLANSAGMSRFHFHRVFKAVTGITPKAYADTLRARRVKEELSGKESVTGAIYGAGFNSSGRFYASTNNMLGMTPTEFRKGGSGASIRFALGECSLGAILVAATDRGVCAIMLGDDPDDLVREFQDRFRNAELIGGDKKFEKLVARVVGFVEAPGLGLDLPLDMLGTAFQKRVWQALRKIPPGSTASYKEIAERIGSPKAARAVAGACASNNIAVAIPCHRVVRNDGSLSGYRWGVARKRSLLDREAG
jgi:AraC family transcriptional regulator, regulatory protein of adaptative response / methylated-DNA-[protein]-cysteine methyltransferase